MAIAFEVSFVIAKWCNHEIAVMLTTLSTWIF